MFDFTIIALPGSLASAVGVSLDLLASAKDLALETGSAVPRWRVCYPLPRVALSNGLIIEAKALPSGSEADGSTWIVPGLGLGTPAALEQGLLKPEPMAVVRALARRGRREGKVAASCSAVFLLQAAGLLAGRRATTTWWLGARLRELEPRCRIDVDQMVIEDGNIVTAGAAFAHVDLMLHLLGTRFGPNLTRAVASAMVVEGRRSQAPFIVPASLAGGDDLVKRAVAQFEAGFPDPPTVAELARTLGVSSRTFSRRIKAATGRTASALLRSVRLHHARTLLETSHLSIEHVAELVGYTDSTALRRLMVKATKQSPSRFRTAQRGG